MCVLEAESAGLNKLCQHHRVRAGKKSGGEILSDPITPGHLGFWQLGRPFAPNDALNDEALGWQLEREPSLLRLKAKWEDRAAAAFPDELLELV